jgi:5-epi-alpha-selinene synthase
VAKEDGALPGFQFWRPTIDNTNFWNFQILQRTDICQALTRSQFLVFPLRVCLPLNPGVFMNEFILPELYCPFPSQINNYTDVLEDCAIEWVLDFNLLTNESSYRRFCKSKFFLLTASAYPDSQIEELKIINHWISWLFIWDDQCDMSDLGKQPEVLENFHKRFLEILSGSEIKSNDIPLGRALNDLRQRMLERGSAEWFHYFVRSVESYFNGCVREANNRIQGIVPDIESYEMLRRLSGAMYSVFDLIEFSNQWMLPSYLREDNIVKKLKYMANNIVCWSNDLVSVSKEMASGDVHNLVLVLYYQQHISIDKAIKRAVEIHNNEVLAMINLEASIPSYGQEVDKEFAKYISGIHAWISGNYNWGSQSARYQTVQKLELVPLLFQRRFSARGSANANAEVKSHSFKSQK